MQTSLDCLPCYLKQALYTIRLATADKVVHKEALNRIALMLPELDFEKSPPENAIGIYNLISELSNCADPYETIKGQSNRLALFLRPQLERIIKTSADPLLTAVKLAIAGNIIDYGAHHEFDVDKSIEDSMKKDVAINDYETLSGDVQKAQNILYLADNCGELVFDELLIRQITRGKNMNVTLAVKDAPIINDALKEDALFCGLGEISEITSNGTGCPGTPLKECSLEFQDKFQKADLIISKGQGNFETLSEVKSQAPIYFLLTVKCNVVAEHAAKLGRTAAGSYRIGDMLVMKKIAREITGYILALLS